LRGERVIVCVRSDHHQRLTSVDAAELLSEYGCQCVRCDGCTQRVSTFFWTPLYCLTADLHYVKSCSYMAANLTGRDFIFRLPQEEVTMYEPREHHVYDTAYRRGLSNRDCPDLYSACPFSLLDIFLSTPTYE
jgi:hypothetical protein